MHRTPELTWECKRREERSWAAEFELEFMENISFTIYANYLEDIPSGRNIMCRGMRKSSVLGNHKEFGIPEKQSKSKGQ